VEGSCSHPSQIASPARRGLRVEYASPLGQLAVDLGKDVMPGMIQEVREMRAVTDAALLCLLDGLQRSKAKSCGERAGPLRSKLCATGRRNSRAVRSPRRSLRRCRHLSTACGKRYRGVQGTAVAGWSSRGHRPCDLCRSGRGGASVTKRCGVPGGGRVEPGQIGRSCASELAPVVRAREQPSCRHLPSPAPPLRERVRAVGQPLVDGRSRWGLPC